MKELFLKRAKENLLAAELLLGKELFNASANRAYYAAFHVAITAIYSIGIEPKIEHKAVHSIFIDNYFNKKKILPSKLKSYLGDLRDKRNTADYKTGINKKSAKSQLDYAKQLVTNIFEVINDNKS